MNGEELKTLTRKLDDIGKSQSDLGANVAALTAEVKLTNDQHRKELDILFGEQRTQGGRISRIERDYVPDAEFKGCQGRSLEEHREHRDEIGALQIGWARVLGGAAAAAVLMGIVVVVLMRLTS